jgi:hypothetical protein
VNFEDKDIIQINSTVIAGAFVFLTVTGISTPIEHEIASKLGAIALGLGLFYYFHNQP